MSYRKIEDWDVDEVCTFLDSIGLGDKVGPFRTEAVDGALLLDLEQTELVDELGLTKAECDRVKSCLDFTRKIVEAKIKSDESEDAREKVNMLELKVSDLECALEEKDGRIKDLEAATSVYVPPREAPAAEASSPPPQASPAPAPAPTPPPESAKPQPPKKEEKETPKKEETQAKPKKKEEEKPKKSAAPPKPKKKEEAKPKKKEEPKPAFGLMGIREKRKKEGKKVLFGGPGKGWLS